MSDQYKTLEESISKLGKSFLLGRKKILSGTKASLESIKISLETTDSLKSENKKIKNKNISLGKDLKASQEEKMELAKQNNEKSIKLRNFDLVSDALKSKPAQNKFVDDFENLIKTEFKELCDKIRNLNHISEEEKLRHVLNEMQLIASCPSIHSRSIGAIGGGFSSGKSSFINSFITSSQLRLAEGIKPVTAIPSYVVCDEKSQVKGITYKGGVFDISLEMYKDISHEFLKSFPFNLNEIVVYTTVLCPVNKEYFNHLCIIDTPGYNAPSAGTAEHDTATAKTYIKDAQFLIWIIGLDTNGTIPSSDIAFLDDLDFGKPDGRLLYVIANKAEIKTQSDIEQILDNFEQTLDDMGIEYAGISAYSSKKKQLYGQRKIDIFEFLKAQNIPNQKIGYLSNLLEEVFGVYQKTIIKEHQDNKTKRKKVKAIILDAFEGGKIGPDKTPNKLEEGLNTLLHYFQPGQLEDSQKLVEAVLEKFQQCFLGFCDELGIDRSALPSKDPVSKSTKEAANEEKSKSGENDVEEAYKNLFGNGEGSLLEIIKQIKYVTTQIKRDIQF